ncbi:MAG: NFACT family protein, partial [Clostridia bacterium]|nr:NFACT family protein [Clostridia bacterium]
MPQDAFTLMHTARELDDMVSGAKIERINQPSKDCVVFSVHKNRSFRLLINANADFARVCVSDENPPAPVQAPPFCMLLRKYLMRAVINAVKAVPYERIITVDLTCRDELGTTYLRTLYLEIMGKYSNVTLVEDGRI